MSLAPVLYIILGGFRTNSQITVDPAGLPHPWEFGNYIGVLKRAPSGGKSATRSSRRP